MPTLPRWRVPALRTAFLAAFFALGPLLLAAPVPLLSQDRDPSEITVIGLVTDQNTEMPVPGVLVEVEGTDRRVLTDSTGIFRIEGVSSGLKTLVLTRLGYAETQVHVTPRPGEPLRVPMIPRAIELEAVAVRVDRLERRLKAIPYSVRAFELDDIVTSAASNPWDFIRTRYSLFDVDCGGDFFERCIRWRGRTIRPTIVIDERPAFGGIDELTSYPLHDIYRIEVIRRGAMIRVYTLWFMEDLAEGRRRLFPVILWQ